MPTIQAPEQVCPFPSRTTQLSLFDDDSPPPGRQARNDIRAGDAAEAFVIAKLLKAGFNAHGVRRDAPYDVGVDLGNGRHCRIEVKGCMQARHGRFYFRFVRGNPRTGTGTYPYSDNDFDITALVALPHERALFVAGVPKRSIRLTTADFLRPGAELQSWIHALNVFNHKQH